MAQVTVPISYCTHGRPALVVGGGEVALRKVQWLLELGVEVEVIATAACSELEELAARKRIRLARQAFSPRDVSDFCLVIAATDDVRANRLAAEAARKSRVAVNVVDTPQLCDFHVPATVVRGPLRLSVGTGGNSPSLAARIRGELARSYPRWYGPCVVALGRLRRELLASGMRSAVLRRVTRALVAGETLAACRGMREDDCLHHLRRRAARLLASSRVAEGEALRPRMPGESDLENPD